MMCLKQMQLYHDSDDYINDINIKDNNNDDNSYISVLIMYHTLLSTLSYLFWSVP